MIGFESIELTEGSGEPTALMEGFEPVSFDVKKYVPKEPRDIVPEEPPSFLRDVVLKTGKDLGKMALGGVEAVTSLASGAAVWPAQKMAGLATISSEPSKQAEDLISDPNFMGGASAGQAFNIKFDSDKAKQAEDALSQFVYQPYTEEGKAATEKIIQGLGIALTPSKMAREELERMGYPLLGYMTEIGGDLATFKMMHSAGKLPKQLREARALKEVSKGPAPDIAGDVKPPERIIEKPPTEVFEPAELSETAIPEGRNIADTLKDLNDFFGEKGAIAPEGIDLTKGQKAALSRLRGDLETYKAKAKEAGKALDQWLIDSGVEPETASLLMREAEEMGKYAGSINIERQNIPEELKQVEHDLMADRPKKTQTWDETNELSDDMIKDAESTVKTIKGVQKRKAFISAEEADAMRKVNVNAIHALKDVVEKGTPEEAASALKNYQDNIQNVTSDASSEAGRILNVHKREIAVTRMGKALGKLQKGMNERQYQELLELDLTDAAAVKEFTRRLPDPKISDYFLEYWYNSILSGPPTHLVNILSNTAWQAFQVPHAAISAAVDLPYSKLTGKARTRYMNEIVPMMAGYGKGFKPGAKAAWGTFRNKKVSEFESKFSLEMESSKDAFARSPNKTLRKISPYINPPTRALRAMDIWANQMAYDAAINRIVRREVNVKGLKGAERKAFETERAQKIIEDGGELHEEAMKQARYNTFTDMPDKLTEHIIKARSIPVVGPALRMTVLPFVNTISNLLKRGVEMTPGLGVVKEAVSRGMGRGANTPEVIAKQIEGAVIAYYALKKASDGEITGESPKTAAEREAWYRQGKKPWSMKIGDNWVQYRRMEPYNTPIAMAANVWDKIKNAPDEQTRTEAFTRYALSIKENVIEGSYFEGLQSLFDKYGKMKTAVPRFAASWVPYSSFLRSMNRAYEVATEGEAKPREGNAWLKAFSSVIPGMSSKMPAKLNVYGEESVIPGGVLRQWLPFKWDLATDDPLETELDRMGFYPSRPPKTFRHRDEKIKIPDSEYRSYSIDYGSQLKTTLMNAIHSGVYQNRKTDEKKLEILTGRMNKTKAKAKNKLVIELRKKGLL